MKRILALLLALLSFVFLFACQETELPATDEPSADAGENDEAEKTPSEPVKKCDHEYGTWKIVSYPTKEKWGENSRTCVKCGEAESMAVPYGSYSAGLKYVSNGDGTCSVERYGLCEDENVIIPPYNEIGEPVTNIREYAFYGCVNIKSVVLPETLTAIGPGGFYGCSGIVEIVIPEKVTFIGNSAFFRCSSLSAIYLPDTMEVIGYNCIGECFRLRRVYYAGPQEKWDEVTIHTGNELLLRNNVLVYDYSAEK